MPPFSVGCLDTPLALAQTKAVVTALAALWPEQQWQPLGFSRNAELETALRGGKLLLAVRDLAKLALELPRGVELAAVTRRSEAREVLVGRSKTSVQGLKAEATLGYSHPRQRAQLASLRPDLTLAELAEDGERALAALDSGQVEALLLPAHELAHLQASRPAARPALEGEVVASKHLLGAPGQGCLALLVAQGNDLAEEIATSQHHRLSFDRVRAERAFLAGLAADGRSQLALPIAALATIGSDGLLTLEGLVASRDGQQVLRASIDGERHEARSLGAELAEDVLMQGGREILG
jgi:hydroxymethylbilane synthase